MRHFLDTEFIEGFRKPLFFGKKWHFIDLVSIGVVSDDGREYYAISKEYSEKYASLWVKEKVLEKLPHGDSMLWKTNRQIALDLLLFFGCEYDNGFWAAPASIEVYGYYADYDWVLFCSLFGTMMDLPKGFPMYCRDLKQMLDHKISPQEIKAIGYKAAVDRLKKHSAYPAQTDEHNALADARWNKQLFHFLNTHL